MDETVAAEHKVVREGWPPGPWDSEPDREEWTTAPGYPGLIVRNELGALCGYVGLPPGHPCHGEGYDNVPVEAHGGLTYAGACWGHICHVPKAGEPDDVWWVGFDTAHAFDVVPGMRTALFGGSPRPLLPGEEYRDLAYVTQEVERLADQLAWLDTRPVRP